MAAHGVGLQANHLPSTSRGVGRAWLALCFALGVHVADESATGFLAVYNPTVLAIRDRAPWWPMPVFDYDTWMNGLIAAVLILCALTPLVYWGARWTRPIAYAFAGLMIANVVAHTLGTALGRTVASVMFHRPMPGFYSSPLLLAAAIYLLLELRASANKEAPRAHPTTRPV